MAMRKPYVLVVGSAHLDVTADYRPANAARMDKIGTVRFSVGGTAYNVAINLGSMNVPTGLLTVLRERSFSSIWIRERLKSCGVSLDFVELTDRAAEGGFVAVREDGDMRSAVTASPVGQHTFSPERLEAALSGAAIAVFDCNLASDQLHVAVEMAQSSGKPVVLAAVSDSKVGRITELTPARPVDLVSLNEAEASVVFGAVPTDLTEEDARRYCSRLNAATVILTRGKRGYVGMTASGSLTVFAAPEVENVVSVSGAGDALLAAVIGCWFKLGRLDLDAAYAHVCRVVRRSLENAGATPGALATDSDLAALARVATRELPFIKRITQPDLLVAILFGILGLLIGSAQLFYATLDSERSPAEAQAKPVGEREVVRSIPVLPAPPSPKSSAAPGQVPRDAPSASPASSKGASNTAAS